MKATRILSLAFVVFACMTATSYAALVDEPFSYPDGPLNGQGGWALHSGSTPNQLLVSGGKAVVNMTLSEDLNKPLGMTLGAGGVLYAAMDVSMTASGALAIAGGTNTSEYFAHFKDATTGFRGRVFATGIAGSDYTYGVRGTSGTNPSATWGTGFAFGSVQRVVVSYWFDTGLSELWVDPVDYSSPKILATDFGAASAILAIALRESSAGTNPDPTVTIDNLVVDTTWVPEPATLSLLGLGALALIRRRR